MKYWSAASGYLVMFISIPLIWLIAVHFSNLPEAVLPPPGKVYTVLTEETGMLWHSTDVTLKEAFIGYALANLVAISVALLYVYLAWTQSFITPWLIIVKNIPIVTIAGMLTILFGDTLTPKIIIIVLACFFPLVSNLVKGLQSVDPVLIDRMRVLNASPLQIFLKVGWPTALPFYVAAHEISFTGCIAAAIVAEFFFSREGLGYIIVQSTVEYRADRLYSVMLIASLLSIGTYFICRIWEAWLLRWKT